jgi:hypothetical protein
MLTGILFVLRTVGDAAGGDGVPSGVTCWRKLRDWQAAGV